MLVRALAIVWVFILLAACSGDDGQAKNETGASSTSPRPDADRTRPPLSFRPVTQLMSSSECTAARGADRVPSYDRSTCFLLGAPEVVVTGYGANAGKPGGSLTDAGVVEVTLGPEDLKNFNELAQLCFARSTSCPTGQLAIVFGNVVRVAPAVQEPEFSGSIAITGTAEEMRELLRDMDR